MRFFYTLVAFELFLGGGGRLLEIGPLTVRMLFFAAMIFTIFAMAVIRPHRDDQFLAGCAWVLAYLCVHSLAFTSGLLHGYAPMDVLADMQQSSFWLAAPFFAVALSDKRLVWRTEHLIVGAAVVMSLAYLATVASVLLGYIEPSVLWETLLPSGEFFFRNELLFFYKGNLYLGIAIIFLVAGKLERPWVLCLIVVALLMTLTRGFVLATFIALLAMFAAQSRWRSVLQVLSITLVALLVVQAIVDFRGESLIGDRGDSDGVRLGDFRFMLEQMTAGTVLVGEGFGSLINGRMNTETSYAWMLWKGGLPLLAFWLTPICVAFVKFLQVPRSSDHYRLACAYFFSILFIYIQTATNPFLNNPIGLSFVMIAVFALHTLAKVDPAKSPVCTAEPTVPQLQVQPA